MRQIKRGLLLLLAGLFLVEAWLWDILCALGLWFAARIPFEAFKRAVAVQIERLSPPFVLPFFILPVMVILPFKLCGLWLIAHHRVILGGLVFLAAKMSGLAVTAFLYELTRDKLRQMAWFCTLSDKVIAAKLWAEALIAPYKAQIHQMVVQIKALLPQVRGQFTTQILRLRRKILKIKA